MPYVVREDGSIVGAFRFENTDAGATEWLEETDAEVIAFRNPPEPTNDEIYDIAMLNEKVLKALILAINDGSFVPGSNYTNAQLKTGIKNRM